MSEPNWNNIVNNLESCGFVCHWSVTPQGGLDPNIEENVNPYTFPVCQGCGKDLKQKTTIRIPAYCEECMNCRNNETDYEEVRDKVWAYMENLTYLNAEYAMDMRWMRAGYGFKPVRVKYGRIRKARISVRCLMKRESLDVHFVDAYISLWLLESGADGKSNRDRCIRYMKKIGITGTKKRKMCRILVIWYVLQYLYWKNLPDQARRLRRIAIKDKKIGEGLKKLIDADKCYPYLVLGESGSEYLDRILKKHPIAEMY